MAADHDSPVLAELGTIGVVPVVTIDEPGRAAALGAALVAGGLPCAEITFRTPAAAAAIQAMSDAHPELLVGAGTIATVEQADAAVAAGARFVVAPGFDETVVDWCRANDVPIAPGVMTPTEINMAIRRGLRLLKFFPAEAAGGVAALTAIAAAYPDVRFVPTGGIDAANLADYLRLPTVAACGGSWVAPRAAIADGDFARIERLAADAAAIVRATRREA
jgi:2-dehydro-3-deoxyphosphogluconate aldolase/(4S)-4-hydroxy-2-oxoglutarate aldolase